MELFEEITDKKELDNLLYHLRQASSEFTEARKTAKDIITRKIPVREFMRTQQRKLFPQFQQLVLEMRELIVEAKEQRSNVQRTSGEHDNS